MELGPHYDFWGPRYFASMGLFLYKNTKNYIWFYNCFGTETNITWGGIIIY